MDAQEGKFFAALLIAVCIIATILIFFITTIIRYHRRHVVLYREKLAAEINILEKERARIAADLHDQLGPILSTVKLQASALEPVTESDKAIIAKLKDNIDFIISDIRAISNDLRPGILHQYGFYKAIGAFADNINDGLKIRILYSHKGSELPLVPEVEIHVFRIIQELVNNAIKHSGAATIELMIHHQGSRLFVLTADDGRGFNWDEALNNSKGLGIQSMMNRVELLNGKLECNSTTDGGTKFKLIIPVFYEQRENKSFNSG